MPTMPMQEDDCEVDHVVVAAWEEMQARQDARVNSSPCDSGDDFVISIDTKAWTAVFRGDDDDRVIAAAKKGAPTSAPCSLYKLVSFSYSNYSRVTQRNCAIAGICCSTRSHSRFCYSRHEVWNTSPRGND